MLAIRGDVVLLGGPVFPKGTKVAMGEALSKIQASLDVRAEATKTP